ncbi:MAG TPA: OmpA family protein [Polyangiaceae bacterium]|nr:OmpA family protein [Polyangiaceae bacterium]
MANTSLISLALILTATGCVSSGKYDQALQDAQKLRAAQAVSRTTLQQKDTEIARLNDSLGRLDAEKNELASELHLSVDRYAGCSTSLDELTAQDQQLRAELAKQGKNVDELLSSKGALASSLAQAKARLEELRKAQAAAEARASLFRGLALKLRHMLDAGELEISLRSGRMVLILPTDVLFDSGKAKVGSRGREALSQVAAALATIKERRFQVSGHTDNDPIRFSGFESNWELSTARALQVVKVLTESGMAPATLSAAGYGEFDPVALNDTAEHKAKNRRIEITLQPNIDELVAVPQSN